MAKKTTRVKAKMSKRHVRAGKIGGLAQHFCRGSECTKLRNAAQELKKARGYSAEELLEFLGVALPMTHGAGKKAVAKKAVKKAAVKKAVKKRIVKKAVAKRAVKKRVVKKAAKKGTTARRKSA